MSHAVRTAPTGPIRRLSFRRATPPFCLLPVPGAAVAVAGAAATFVAVALVVAASAAVAAIVTLADVGRGERRRARVGEHACGLAGRGGLRWRRSGGRRCRCRCRWRWRWRCRCGRRGRGLRGQQMRPIRVPDCAFRRACRGGGPRDRAPRHVRRGRDNDACELGGGCRRGGDVHRHAGPVHDAVLPRRSDRGRDGLDGWGCREVGQNQGCRDFGRLDQVPRQEQEPADHRERERPRRKLRP
jgi:hypothetical protein